MKITSTQDISIAVDILAQGRIVACPTGTSYALAADALQGFALARLRQLKQRPQEKAFTIFLHESLWDTYLDLSPEERIFLKKNRNQAITLLVRPKTELAHVAQDGYVGLRVIDHPLMASLAMAYAKPLTATSANKSGQQPCHSPGCIQENFKNPLADGSTYDLSLGIILDAGELPASLPSTIIKFEESKIKIIRPGKNNNIPG
jgi:L-threonylcarbamoyladenylate synthase